MLIVTRLALPLIFIAGIALILAQWYRAMGFLPLDGRWWEWLLITIHRTGTLPGALLHPVYWTGAGMLPLMGLVMLLATAASNRTENGGFKSEELHGSARWARRKDVKEAGLFTKVGVVVGGWRRAFGATTLRHDGPEHVFCFAPTRSGKGVSLIVPTLLSWKHSLIVLDIKGENYALSAGWRASLGHRILKFDPTAPTGSVRYNPLAEIRTGSGRDIADCQNVALMIVDGEGKGLKDYWMKEGWAWLTTALLHVLYRVRRDENRTATLADVNTFLSGIIGAEDDEEEEGAGFTALLNDMIAFEHGDPDIDAEVRRGANRMKLKAHEERSGVHSSAITGMSLFADPIIARNTGASDFTVADLMHGEAPAALYLMLPPSDIGRVRPLLRIMLTQILGRLTESMAFEDGRSIAGYKHRLLLLLDEFTSVGKLEIVEKALAYMAGYGIKAMIFVQDLAQLVDAYGKDEGITGNCHVRIAFAPNKFETARVLSDMAGRATVVQRKRSRSGRVGEIGSVSDNLQETSRPLITPDEAMRLRGIRKGAFGRVRAGEVLTFVAGSRPIRGVQRLYFQNRTLQTRARMKPPADAAPTPAPAAAPTPATTRGEQTDAAA